MVPGDNEKPHRLEDIQKRLYSPNPNAIPPKRPGVLHQIGHTVSGVWSDEKTEQVINKVQDVSMRSSTFKKIFIGSLIFFIIALVIGAFLFITGGNSVSSDNVSISVLGNAYTPGGEDLPLTIQIANSNAVPLELADLVVEYGRNKPDLSDPSDIQTARQSIGTIPSGKSVSQKVDLTLYGDEGSTKQVQFTVEYHIAGSNVVFQQSKIFPVTINTAPVALTVNADTSTTANQPYTLLINVTPNVQKTIPNMMLSVDYPPGFTFQNAEPGPSYLTNVWNLGDLTPGQNTQIKIVGTIDAQDGEERSFRVYTGSQSTSDKNAIGTTFSSTLHTVDIVKPFLQADLAVNGQTGPQVVAQPKSTITGNITWSNNLPTQILNAKIVATLNGTLINQSSVEASGGFYNSADNTITWDRNTDPELASVNPGASGSLAFDFSTLSLYQNGQISSDPEVSIDVAISGEQPQQGSTDTQQVNSVEHTDIKLSTDFQITGAGLFSQGPFTNTGTLPPVANQKTTYTIKWSLTSSANDVSGVVVRASLPTYVHFLNLINPTTANVTIDPVSGDIVWNVGTLPKGSGFTGDPVSVYFQVEFDPSLSQVGTAPVLVNKVTATGTDTYTNTPLTATWDTTTTQLFNDPSFQQGDEKVVGQ